MTYWELVRGALALDPAAFLAINTAPQGLRLAILTLVLAGASETLGQSVVLVLNRVSKARFCAAIMLGGAELVLEALIWIVSVWLVVRLQGEMSLSFDSAVRVVGLAYAPVLLGVFVFFPSLGPIIARLLRLWTLLAAIVGISVVVGVAPLIAALIAAGGFLVHWVLLQVFAGVAQAADHWFWRASTGRAAPFESTDALR
jgi:hypothetical protein